MKITITHEVSFDTMRQVWFAAASYFSRERGHWVYSFCVCKCEQQARDSIPEHIKRVHEELIELFPGADIEVAQ